MTSPLANLARLRPHRTRRASSWDRTGGNSDFVTIGPGETATLAALDGPGVITHLWVTIDADDPLVGRHAVLRMRWDGEDAPSVEAPIGDFFGQGWGEHYPFMSLPLAAAPAGGRAWNCYLPMPFASSASITVENQSELPIRHFYFYVDYEQRPTLDDDVGRFHAWWNRTLTTPAPGVDNEWLGPEHQNASDDDNYVFAEIEGQGHFVGVHYFVDNPGPMWYGEGDDMWVVDGEAWPPALHGTGTEDFFNTAWGPNEIYQHPYFGIAKVPHTLGWLGRTHCYRFFVEDPIHFQHSLRASIEHGHANGLTLDLASVAYWYQREPHRPFPPLPLRAERHPMPEIGVEDVHRWRHAWRHATGGTWGNETRAGSSDQPSAESSASNDS